MKRSRVIRARALFDDADVTGGLICASTTALASVMTDLVARTNQSIQQALAQVASFRSAVLARKTRVLGSAKRLSLKQFKAIIADFEAVDVSAEQLRVWAGVAGAGTACPDVDCVFAASPLLASPRLLQFPEAGLRSIVELVFGADLGSVATGDGLRVVSAAGPGLQWFEPHSRNEFSVVLAQANGSVPIWLTAGDVVVDVMSQVETFATAAAGACVGASDSAAVRSEWVRQGTVSVVYGSLVEDALGYVLQLYVCGAPVANAAGDRNWCVRVPRKPLAGHECAALGTHVRTLAVVEEDKYGMAVSADEKWLVVGSSVAATLSVFSLPGGELVRTYGGRGDGPLQFYWLCRLCFALNGNLIVADGGYKRLQAVTLEGVFVRFIGEGEFGDGYPFGVAVHNDIIAVGCSGGTGPRVVLLDFDTGALTSRFGEVGTAPGQLSQCCTGIRFTPDGMHLILAEYEAKRLSLFTIAGVFVRCVGVGVLLGGGMDVLQSVAGEYVVADFSNHRVCVLSLDGSELVRSWGVRGAEAGDGQFEYPTALAAARTALVCYGLREG